MCEDDIMIDDNFSFKYFARTKAFSVQLAVNVPPVLSIPVISSSLLASVHRTGQYSSQATGLSALHGREGI